MRVLLGIPPIQAIYEYLMLNFYFSINNKQIENDCNELFLKLKKEFNENKKKFLKKNESEGLTITSNIFITLKKHDLLKFWDCEEINMEKKQWKLLIKSKFIIIIGTLILMQSKLENQMNF